MIEAGRRFLTPLAEKLDGMFLPRIRKDTGNPQVKYPAESLPVSSGKYR